MIFSAIDIGSNAGRLLVSTVYEFNGNPVTEKITLVRVPLRLGFDVFDKGFVSQKKIDMIIRTFETYNQLLSVYQPVDFVACCTEAMREASNSLEIIERVKRETGVDLIIIDGDKEAAIISKSENTNLRKVHDHSLYIDVGGGSTEISWFEHDVLKATRSFKIGTIRLLLDNVPHSDWDEMKHWIQDLRKEDLPINCICSGGNINKLTKLYGNREKNSLTYSQLVEGHEFLEGYPIEYRIETLGLRADRADVIVPAAIIFKKLMKWGNIHEIQAPKIGLADGLIAELYKQHKGRPSLLD
ncbi:MAG: Ppx/GppA family phosphatase [Salinivirgaceae bacterium]|jgi:exopolyphosphatase/guanosine-5'-triphosphate,3'-diphosphate pyrophosphatase|nr:Ppx/GppA family phosphatase [Salinivirgaceae bacterium]